MDRPSVHTFFCCTVFVTLSLLTTYVEVSAIRDVNCHQNYERICFPPDQPEPANFPDNTFPDGEFLNANCDTYIRLQRCTIEFNRTCPFGRSPVEPIRDLEELSGLVEEICDENSNLRQTYEENLDCLRSVSDKLQEEMENASKLTDSFIKALKPEGRFYSENQWRAIHCTTHKFVIPKLLNIIYEGCDVEATVMAYAVVPRIVTPYKEICPPDDKDIQKHVTILEEFYFNSPAAA